MGKGNEDIDTPLVSIVSGYYNREDYVDDSIQSLLDQTYRNIEIVVFDDCSTDGTYKKLIAFEQKDDRVKIIRHEVNRGFVRGLIEAIRITKGKYIAIHGSGDYSYPDRIKLQSEALEQYPNVGVVGSFIENVRMEDSIHGKKEHRKLVDKKLMGSAKEQLLRSNPFSHGEVMYRRELYDQVGGYRELFKFAQDRDLWCRMSMVCDFYIVPQLLYKRYELADGVSFSINKVIIQRVLSEFAVQNHELHLKGDKDLVQLYGIQSLLFFEYTQRFITNFFPVAMLSFKRSSSPNLIARQIVKHIVERYSFNRYALILRMIYFVFPYSVSKFIVARKIKD